MSIVTKTGDLGKTGLLSGERVSKSDPRVEVYGTLDELVSCLGFARGAEVTLDTNFRLKKIQEDLFRLGAELASTKLDPRWKVTVIGQEDTAALETLIKKMEPELHLPKSFVLPGGSLPSGAIDMARSVSRRLERQVVHLLEQKLFSNREALIYLNRLSDFLFVLARAEHLAAGKNHEPV